MIRGTTPTHTFNLKFDTSLIDKVKITYAQNDHIIFEKLATDCVLDGFTIKTVLTQEETLKLDHNSPVQIQLRILTTGGNALASVVQKVGVSQLLDDGVFE